MVYTDRSRSIGRSRRAQQTQAVKVMSPERRCWWNSRPWSRLAPLRRDRSWPASSCPAAVPPTFDPGAPSRTRCVCVCKCSTIDNKHEQQQKKSRRRTSLKNPQKGSTRTRAYTTHESMAALWTFGKQLMASNIVIEVPLHGDQAFYTAAPRARLVGPCRKITRGFP